MPPHQLAGCPDEALLDAYVGGSGDDDDREVVEGHIAECQLCRQVVAAVARATEASSAAGGRHKPSEVPTRLAASLGPETLSPQRAGAAAVPGEELRPGATVDRYIIIGEVGRGGMGELYAAWDPDLDRRVALKLLHRGNAQNDSASLRERSRGMLLREAKAMAQLSHPNVLQVFEVVQHDETLLIAMEFVEGETLAAWQRRPGRSWMEVLAAYLQAGEGLSAAHAAGLIHRDFKPHNAMVDALPNGRVRVRVLDFGLVRNKAPVASVSSGEGSSVDEDAGLSRTGGLVGTPAYMAPEQFAARNSDARTDQFNYCVALWEGLFGQHPFDDLNVSKLMQAVLAGERRPAPSDKSIPRWVVRAVNRGLCVDPNERWPTMDALLAALSRRPARRRWAWRSGAALLIVTGLAGAAWWRSEAQVCSGADATVAGVWDDARRLSVQNAVLETNAAFAQDSWERIAPELDRWASDWASMYTETCIATQRRHEQSEAVMDLRIACLHRALRGLDASAAVLEEATPKIVENAHNVVNGLPVLSHCADVEALLADISLPDPHDADAVAAIEASLAEAKARRQAGDYEAALEAAQRADDASERIDYEPVRIQIQLGLGLAHDAMGKYEEANAALRQAQVLGARWRQWDAVRDATVHLLGTLESQALYAEALTLSDLSSGLAAGDPLAEASFRNNLGNVQYAQGKYEKAEAEYRRALVLRERELGPEHAYVGDSRNNLAGALYARGDYEAAELEHRRALAIRENALGPEHPLAGNSHGNLGVTLYARGEHEESQAEHRRALEILQKSLGPEHPHVAKLRASLGSVLRVLRRYEEAEVELRQALGLFEKTLGPEHPTVAVSLDSLGTLLHTQGKVEEAEAELRRALALRSKTLPADHPSLAMTRSNLAVLVLERGHADEALVLAEHSWNRQQRDDIPPEIRARSAFVLAQAIWQAGTGAPSRARARTLAETALQALQEVGAAQSEEAESVHAWLRDHGQP